MEAELTLRVQDLDKAEAVTRRIEEQTRQAVPHVERVLIHAEPMERTHLRYAAPLAEADGALSEHFGGAPYFALVTSRAADGVIEERQTLANPFVQVEKAKGINVSEWLVDHKVDVVFLKESLRGKGPTYVFGDAAVEMRETDATTLEEALEEMGKEDIG